MKLSLKKKGRHHPPQKRIIKGRARTTDGTIFIVALSLLVGIALLSSFFTSSASTGRAIQTVGGDAVDLILEDNVLRVHVDVTARSIGALSFTLSGTNADGTFDSCDYTSRSLVSWEFPLTECSNQQISYGVATLNPASFMSGSFVVAEFTFPNMGYGDIEFRLSNLQVWDTTAGGDVINLFDGADTFTEQFTREVPIVVAVALPAGGDGGGSSGGGPTSSSSGNSIECIRDWQCADWTECKNGQQRRSCYDTKNCAQNTTTRIGYKIYPVILAGPEEPAEMKSCSEQDSSLSAQAQQPQSPALGTQSGLQQQQSQLETSSFIEKYKAYFIALLLLLVVVLIVIITIIHHRHKPTYNSEELKTWIKQERTTGTSDQDIMDIIKDKTGWKKDEVTAMFQELDAGR